MFSGRWEPRLPRLSSSLKWFFRLLLPLAIFYGVAMVASTFVAVHAPPETTEAAAIMPPPLLASKSELSAATTKIAHTVPLRPPSESEELSSLSSVDYFACCGLGHRLIRMSAAHYVARVKGFSLRSFWGWCGEQNPIEVFSYIFEPPSQEELQHVTSRNIVLPFYNSVPGFVGVKRKPTKVNSTACPCHGDKIDADLELYSSLRRRFRAKSQLDVFVKEHFESRTVIGIHIRAGNGEKGEFVRKGRTIDNPTVWVRQVSQLIRDFLQSQKPRIRPPLLYIATDTPSMVSLFRQELEPANIPVLDLPQQERREEGQGVLFGVSQEVHDKDENSEDDHSGCLNGWTHALMDMFLLSHADVVVAATPSSFTQSAPMSLAFGDQTKRRKLLSKPYCEVVSRVIEEKVNSTKVRRKLPPTLQCYESYQDWCCNYSTWVRFVGRHVHRELVEFVRPENLADFERREYPEMRNRSIDCSRPRRGVGLKNICLPYQW